MFEIENPYQLGYQQCTKDALLHILAIMRSLNVDSITYKMFDLLPEDQLIIHRDNFNNEITLRIKGKLQLEEI